MNANNTSGGFQIPDIDAATAVQFGGGAAANLMGKFSGPAQVFFDMAASQMQTAKIEGDAAGAIGQTAAVAKVDSAAYDNFTKNLEEKASGETLKRSVASIAGAAAGGLLLSFLPFGGIIGMLAGGFAGNMLADKYLTEKRYDFSEFAKSLDAASQNGTLTGERVAVAMVLGIENKPERRALYQSYGFKTSADMVDALNNGDPRITQMMEGQDALIRQKLMLKDTKILNAQTGKNLTASELLANYYNSPAGVDPVTGLKGANLLSSVNVGNAVIQMNTVLSQFEQQQMQSQMKPNPGDLPNLKAQQHQL